MAKNAEITYYPNAQVRSLSDGSIYTLGMTVESMEVEVCGNTHPFYTGKNTTIDTAGRIDKFNARALKASDNSPVKTKKRSNRKIKLSISDLNSGEKEENSKVAEISTTSGESA